jgi:hypothetical protein
MTNLNPDVVIYINRLKNYLHNNEVLCQNLFGKHDLSDCMAKCMQKANDNYKEFGDPVLTKEQFQQIRSELDGKPKEVNITVDIAGVFIPWEGNLPICLN